MLINRIVVISVLILTIMGMNLIGCAVEQPIKFRALLSVPEEEITGVILRSGLTGEAVAVHNRDVVTYFFSMLEDQMLTRAGNQDLRAGYSYAARLYRDDQPVAVIIFLGELIRVNDTYYTLSEAVTDATLASFFNYLAENESR